MSPSSPQLSLLTVFIRGPLGCRVGDVIVAEGSRWLVVDVDQERHEAVCSLIAGARVLHRFRARQITRVERHASPAAASDASPSAEPVLLEERS